MGRMRMAKIRSWGALGLCALIATGCTGFGLGVDQAKDRTPTGSEFTKSLYGGYMELARSESAEGDYLDSDRFADYAIQAAGGSAKEPDAVSSRSLPTDKVSELSDARERLVRALAAGASDKLPQKAATALVMYDCWLQEQEENFQPKDIERCRAGFQTAMGEVEEGLRPRKVAAVAKPAPKAPPKPIVEKFLVYFGFDSSKPVVESDAVIKQAVAAAKKLEGAKINLVGHTDTAGSQGYNLKLSDKRVATVVDAFKSGGISTSAINLASLGESNPAVKTGDGVRNLKNRRVEIVITK